MRLSRFIFANIGLFSFVYLEWGERENGQLNRIRQRGRREIRGTETYMVLAFFFAIAADLAVSDIRVNRRHVLQI